MNEIANFFSDTKLFYFYSSFFQGHAALFTLGIMFILYHYERQENKKNILNDALIKLSQDEINSKYTIPHEAFQNIRGIIKTHGVEYFKNGQLLYVYNQFVNLLINESDTKIVVKKISRLATLLLIISLIGLLLCNISFNLNIALYAIAVLLTLVSIYYFYLIIDLIKKILLKNDDKSIYDDIAEERAKNLKEQNK